MKSFLQMLCEDTLSHVINNHPDVHPEEIKRMHNLLPNEDKSPRALEMLVRLYKNGQLQNHHLDDTFRNREGITNNIATLARAGKRNIYSSINSLDDLIHHASHFTKHTETKAEKAGRDSPTVFENDDIVVQQHKTHKACIAAASLHPENPYYGSELKGKANWCVSAESDLGNKRYNNYTNQGTDPAFTVYNKKTHRKFMYVHDSTKTRLAGAELRSEDQSNDEINLIGHDDSFYKLFPGVEHSSIGKLLDNYPETKYQTHEITDELIKNAVKDNMTSVILKNKNLKKTHFDSLVHAATDRGVGNDFLNKHYAHPLINSSHFSKLLSSNQSRIMYTPQLNVSVLKSPHFTKEHAVSLVNDDSLTNSLLLSNHSQYIHDNEVSNLIANNLENVNTYNLNQACAIFDNMVNKKAFNDNHVKNIIGSLGEESFNNRELYDKIERHVKDINSEPLAQHLVNNGHNNTLGYMKFSDDFKNKIINSGDKDQIHYLSFNKHLNSSDISKILNRNIGGIGDKARLLAHPNSNQDSVSKYISSIPSNDANDIFENTSPNLSADHLSKLYDNNPALRNNLVKHHNFPEQKALDIVKNKSDGFKDILRNNIHDSITHHIIDNLPDYIHSVKPSVISRQLKTYSEADQVLKQFEPGGKLHDKGVSDIGLELSAHIMQKHRGAGSLLSRVMTNPLYDDSSKLNMLIDDGYQQFPYTRKAIDEINNSEFGQRNQEHLKKIFSWKDIRD